MAQGERWLFQAAGNREEEGEYLFPYDVRRDVLKRREWQDRENPEAPLFLVPCPGPG